MIKQVCGYCSSDAIVFSTSGKRYGASCSQCCGAYHTTYGTLVITKEGVEERWNSRNNYKELEHYRGSYLGSLMSGSPLRAGDYIKVQELRAKRDALYRMLKDNEEH